MSVTARVSTPPVTSHREGVLPTMVLHLSLIEGMGCNSQSGGQHSDEARPSSYQGTRCPDGACPRPMTVQVEGAKQA